MRNVERPPQLTRHNAEAFQLRSVVDAYHLRTPYPPALTPFLLDLATPRGGPVLELGCGTGEISRALAPSCERVDAIDVSARMIARARTMPGGDHVAIRWVVGAAEDARLDGPYALAIAGDSLHWMHWEVVLPRVAVHLASGAVLAMVHAVIPELPWSAALRELFSRYSVIAESRPFDLVGHLEEDGLFAPIGRETLGPESYTRTIDEYIASLHATSSLPLERMGKDRARAFDDDVRSLIAGHGSREAVELTASAEVVWGAPGQSSKR
jgi:SAM-dependent methyltransferase